MSDFFVGEIRAFSFSWAPKYWAFCDGRPMPIGQNKALFVLLGVQFGGDGRTTFNLPDLQGRVPVHLGAQNFPYPTNKGGSETVTLTTANLPAHNHPFLASTEKATQVKATGNMLATIPPDTSKANRPLYRSAATSATLAGHSVGLVGGGQPHSNMQPSLIVNYCIALAGIFPSRE